MPEDAGEGKSEMQFLPQVPITGAGTFISPVATFNLALPRAITAQASFFYGAGGTSCDAYLQTNVDGGQIQWADVAHFAFTTSTAIAIAKAAADVAFSKARQPMEASPLEPPTLSLVPYGASSTSSSAHTRPQRERSPSR